MLEELLEQGRVRGVCEMLVEALAGAGEVFETGGVDGVEDQAMDTGKAGGEELDELAVELDLIAKRDSGPMSELEHRVAEDLEAKDK